jgi:hypothetical protein
MAIATGPGCAGNGDPVTDESTPFGVEQPNAFAASQTEKALMLLEPVLAT